jgi:hypothetical protein
MVRARKNPVPDGRQNNGGARQGTPGGAYDNRRDLQTQKPMVAPSATYGQGAAQTRAQQAVPMAGVAAGIPQTPAPAPTGPGAGPAPPDLYRATERPGEPVTHGLPTGPGAGPEALPIQNSSLTDPLAIQIRALYQRYPSAELAAVLADL